jgi:GC-rich sequence DNA-binding factor-like protein/Tuftelin interacting protein N terminal/G-patch domain
MMNEGVGDSSDENRGRKTRNDYEAASSSSDGAAVDSSDEDENAVERQQEFGRSRDKQEALYGVFWENSDDSDGGRRKHKSRHSRINTRKASTKAPLFVPAKKVSNEGAPVPAMAQPADLEARRTDPVTALSEPRKETAEEAAWRQEREAANQKFLALLQGANAGRKSTRTSDKIVEEKTMSELGLPSQWGTGAKRNADAQHSDKKKGSNIGQWEKHTKGIGMKLLAKMGYSGSGGLGSKRRRMDSRSESNNEVASTPSETITSEDKSKSKLAKEGIARPIEVVVRPANLGLGFGGFREASKLKVNRDIEAQVTGKEMPTTKKSESLPEKLSETHSSVLPSTSELFMQATWQRGAKRIQGSGRKRSRSQFIPYSELLEKQREQARSDPGLGVVIDMRGPSESADAPVRTVGQSGDVVPLGEELLHNVSLLLNTHENRLHAASHFVRASERQVQSILSDLENIDVEAKKLESRTKKLERLHGILEEIELFLDTYDVRSPVQGINSTIKSWFEEVASVFSEAERSDLKFSQSLVPYILGSVWQKNLDEWNPLTDSIEHSTEIIHGVASSSLLAAPVLDDALEAGVTIDRTMFTQYLLPRLRQALDSPGWNVSTQVETVLQVYEIIQASAETIDGKQSVDQEEETSSQRDHVLSSALTHSRTTLVELVGAAVVQDILYPKLSAALDQWEPSFSADIQALVDRPDWWILPWLPHLDHPSLLPPLIADCKRKIRGAVAYLCKTIVDDVLLVDVVTDTLGVWRGVFKEESIQSMVSAALTPKIAGNMSKIRVHESLSFQDVPLATRVVVMCALGLLSDDEFLSLLEGELLPRWAYGIHAQLASLDGSGESDGEFTKMTTSAVTLYQQWKFGLFRGNGEFGRVHEIIREDDMICRMFYGVLCMIRASAGSRHPHSAVENDRERFTDWQPILENTNYRIVLSRRLAEEKQRAADDIRRMEFSGIANTEGRRRDNDGAVKARVRLHHNQHGSGPTFRDVVTEFARERDVLFQPRLPAQTKDGKTVYHFGSLNVYLDRNVVYVQGGKKSPRSNGQWSPVSLDELATLATTDEDQT